MKEYYTIGEVASLFDISKDTLRFYDEIELLKPWKIGNNGYRYYSKAQFEMISTIILLSKIGTPLKRIKSILHHSNPSMIEQELSAYINDIDEQIRRLTYRKTQTVSLTNIIKDSCYDDIIRLEEIPCLYLLQKQYNSDSDEFDISEIISANSSTEEEWSSYANVISTADKTDICSGNFHKYKSYGYMSEYPCKTGREDLLTVIKNQLYLTCTAKISRIDHCDIDPFYNRLLEYINEKGYEITGDIIERNVIDLYGPDNHDLCFYFKIYIPVKI